MTILKFAAGAVAAVILIRLLLWLLNVVFGIIWFTIGLLKLAFIVGLIMLVIYFVYRLFGPQQKSEA